MTIRNTLKTVALSLVVVAATAGSAFAATAWIDDTTKVKSKPANSSQTLGWAKEGKKVWVGKCFKSYCYIEQKGGADGWVKKSDLAFKKGKKWDGDFDFEFCVGDKNVSFCIEN